jgi:hypothetical protein
MVYFQTKNRNLGKFWRVLQWKILVYFMDIWSILRTFYWHLVNFLIIWCIFPQFGILYQEKSGNPALDHDSVVDHESVGSCRCDVAGMLI